MNRSQPTRNLQIQIVSFRKQLYRSHVNTLNKKEDCNLIWSTSLPTHILTSTFLLYTNTVVQFCFVLVRDCCHPISLLSGYICMQLMCLFCVFVVLHRYVIKLHSNYELSVFGGWYKFMHWAKYKIWKHGMFREVKKHLLYVVIIPSIHVVISRRHS